MAVQRPSITQLFRQWIELSARVEDPAIADEECDAACGQRTDVEKLMCGGQSVSAMDVLMTICAASQFGVFGGGSEWENAVWLEAREPLAG